MMATVLRGLPALARRQHNAAVQTLHYPIKFTQKRHNVLLLVSSVALILFALASHWEQRHASQYLYGSVTATWDNPILKAKDAFSLLSITEEQTTQKNGTQTCFPFNSLPWLTGPRLGNYNDSLMYNNFAVRNTLLWESSQSQFFFAPHQGLAKDILSQTICHENSRFLNLSSYPDIRTWSLRLIYLSLHLHQHEPAMLEARHRYSLPSSSPCQVEYQKNLIGAFDYECPHAKFLVVAMGRLGLGAVMRLGAVNYYIAGISTGRVVLFVNNYHHHNASKVPKFLQAPWMHASCPRRDVQCFFMPSSPCVMTVSALEEAYVLTKGETRQVFRTGAVPQNRQNDRVIVMDPPLRPQRCPENFFPILRNMAVSKIIAPLKKEKQQSPSSMEQIHFLEQAADAILDVDLLDPNRSYSYFGQASKAHHALVFYAMRPNLYYTQQIQQTMAKTVPRDLNPEYSLGLPIRGKSASVVLARRRILTTASIFLSFVESIGQVPDGK